MVVLQQQLRRQWRRPSVEWLEGRGGPRQRRRPVGSGGDARRRGLGPSGAVVVVCGSGAVVVLSGGGGGGSDMISLESLDTKLVGLGFLPGLRRRL